MKFFYLDFETFSPLDLTEVGAVKSLTADGARVSIMAYAGCVGKVKHIEQHHSDMADVLREAIKRGYWLVAHNAEYELAVMSLVLGVKWPLDRVLCTAYGSVINGGPRSLADAGEYWGKIGGFEDRKSPEGKRLIKKFAGPIAHAEEFTDSEDWQLYVDYCVGDVETMRAFFPLLKYPDYARKFFSSFVRMMRRGVPLDMPSINKAYDMLQAIKEDRTASFSEQYGCTPTQTAKVLELVRDMGADVPNLRKETLAQVIVDANQNLIDLINKRTEAAKASTAKLDAFRRMQVRGRYYQPLIAENAFTGRETGYGAQLHNLPRGKTDPDYFVRLHAGDTSIQATADNLRGFIRASRNRVLYWADYSKIEVCVLFWIADAVNALESLRTGDIYSDMGSAFEFIEASLRRQAGKETILGCGYGMGPRKFRTRLKQQGMNFSEAEAKKIVYGYRDRYPEVPALWATLESIATACASGHEFDETSDKGIRFISRQFGDNDPRGSQLEVVLPHGRSLWYNDMRHDGELTFMQGKFRKGLYGGKMCEHVTSGTASGLLKDAIVKVDAAGLYPILTVHDEVVGESELSSEETIKRVQAAMLDLPTWAKGIPVSVEIKTAERYGK